MTSASGSRRLLHVSAGALAIAAWLQSAPLFSQSAAGTSGLALTAVEGRQAIAGEVLVQFKGSAAATSSDRVLAGRIDAEHNVPVGRHGLRRFRSRAFDVDALLAFFRAQPDVAFAEPNYVVRAQTVPNDPQFGSLWNLLNTGQLIVGTFGTPGADISATNAWDVATGSKDIVVGVIDSGIDYTHPDIAANVWSAPRDFSVTIGGVTVHCPAGSHGFNARTKTCDPLDVFSHGTHVAGIIGAAGNNGIGVVGVNWNTLMIGGRFLDDFGVGTTADAIDAIDFMIQTRTIFASTGGANIRVLNNSWGGGAFSQALRDTIELAASDDMLFVAAAGNSGRDDDATPFYPASYDVPNVIAVAATTNRDVLWPSSNYGATSVDLAAPGEWVLSTIPGSGYAPRSGTSMATPHVAGAAALILSACPFDTAALKTALLSTVDGVPALTGLVATGGRLNVDRAIRTCATPSIPAAPTGLAATGGPSDVTLTWDAVSGATSYRVKRATVSGGPYQLVADAITLRTYKDTAVSVGQTYFYVVSAVNALGESPDSSEVFATPVESEDPSPAAPDKLETTPGDAQVSLTWIESQGAIRYRVKRSLAKAGPYDLVGRTPEPSFVDTEVVNGTKYFYVVTAVTDTGESARSNKASATPAPVPGTPVVTAVQGPEAGQIELSWSAVEWATTYRVRRSTTSGGPYSGVRKDPAPSFTDTGLKSGRRYYYFVTALNDSGESPGIEVSAVAK
jgi:subtilisin family serine protease